MAWGWRVFLRDGCPEGGGASTPPLPALTTLTVFRKPFHSSAQAFQPWCPSSDPQNLWKRQVSCEQKMEKKGEEGCEEQRRGFPGCSRGGSASHGGWPASLCLLVAADTAGGGEQGQPLWAGRGHVSPWAHF